MYFAAIDYRGSPCNGIDEKQSCKLIMLLFTVRYMFDYHLMIMQSDKLK